MILSAIGEQLNSGRRKLTRRQCRSQRVHDSQRPGRVTDSLGAP